MAQLINLAPVSLQLGQGYDTYLSAPMQAVDGVVRAGSGDRPGENDGAGANDDKKLDPTEIGRGTFHATSSWANDFKEYQEKFSTSAAARVSAALPGLGGDVSVEAQASGRLFSSSSTMLGKHIASIATTETGGAFHFPGALYESYNSAEHFRSLHGNSCVTAFLTGCSFEGTALATYEGKGSVDEAKASFRASVERSFRVASVGGKVEGAASKELEHKQENWRVEVDYTIIGARMTGQAVQTVVDYSGLVERYKEFAKSCTRQSAKQYGFYILPWSNITGFRWGSFKTKGPEREPLPVNMISSIDEANIYKLLERVEDISAITATPEEYVSADSGSEVSHMELVTLQKHARACEQKLRAFAAKFAAGFKLEQAEEVSLPNDVDPKISANMMPKPLPNRKSKTQNSIEPIWVDLQKGDTLAAKNITVPELMLPNKLPLRDICGERMTFARVKKANALHLGKFWDKADEVFYTAGPGSTEVKHDGPFQVLVNADKFAWENIDGAIPPTAVPCGKTADARNLYAAACLWQDHPEVMIVGSAVNVTNDIAHKFNGKVGPYVGYPCGGKEWSPAPSQAWVMCYPE